MKLGLPASLALHGAILAWAIVSLPGAKTESVQVVDALPVEFVPIAEATQLRLGQKTAPPKEEIVAKAAAKAAAEREGERAGTSKQEEPPPAPPETKPQQVAALPKPEPEPEKPKPEPKAVEKPEPPKSAEKPEPPKEPEKPVEPKAAEKKPDPPPKKPDPAKTAAVRPSETRGQFNANDISQILSRNQTGTSASTTARTAGLGSVSGQNAAIKMTQTEVDALIGQIKKCWVPPIGSAEANIKVTMRFALNQDGTVNGRPNIVEGPVHPLGPSLGRSAERAILQCGPYRLPAEKFATWSNIEATFDPRDL